jgi:hypothetical protein
LKELIRDGNILLARPQKFPKYHDLGKLWIQCKKILRELDPDVPLKDFEAVEECINEFSAIDPTSASFRYPTDKAGRASLSTLRHINLRNLSNVIAGIASFLDGARMSIDFCLEQKGELEAAH